MEIKLPEGLECRWCGDKRLNLVDVYVQDDYIGHMLVVMHCTWCDHAMETNAPIDQDGCITPRLNRRVWRSTHNGVTEWPYGTATVGRFNVYEAIAAYLRPAHKNDVDEIPF